MIEAPPNLENYLGGVRRVGVEIEFAALSAREAARVVQDCFGGAISEIDPHRFEIPGTRLGTFRTELDSQYLHRMVHNPAEGSSGWQPENEPSEFDLLISDFQEVLQEFVGDAGALIIPCEVVCPPVPVLQLTEIETLLGALRAAGAHGTERSLFYAFGAQLNVEIAENSAVYITRVLKAYLLLSEWLRAEIALHLTRRLLAFASPFPEEYVLMVAAPDYWPDLDTLMKDYLFFNPTRNRELDLLPLLSWIDPVRVADAVEDVRVKSRPAFHYRLPDARLGDPSWTITQEWNRWCWVERLSADAEVLAAMGRARLDNSRKPFPEDWARLTASWLGRLR